jgi:hypothetical protein
MADQLSHRSFSVAQQLQQPSPARLGYRSNQVWHHNTLVIANASGKPNPETGLAQTYESLPAGKTDGWSSFSSPL